MWPRFGPFSGLSRMVGGCRLCQMLCFSMGHMLICVVRVFVVVRKSRFFPSLPLLLWSGRPAFHRGPRSHLTPPAVRNEDRIVHRSCCSRLRQGRQTSSQDVCGGTVARYGSARVLRGPHMGERGRVVNRSIDPDLEKRRGQKGRFFFSSVVIFVCDRCRCIEPK